MGLPGLSGFVAELMIFVGTFKLGGLWAFSTVLSVFGVVLAAGYTLWMIQRSFLGSGVSSDSPVAKEYDNLSDMNNIELIGAIILTLTIVTVGVYPSIVTDLFNIGIGEVFSR